MMKSNEIALSNSLSCAVNALQEVEQASRQAGLNREQTNIMRLLTEEMERAVSLRVPLVAEAKIGKTWYDAKG